MSKTSQAKAQDASCARQAILDGARQQKERRDAAFAEASWSSHRDAFKWADLTLNEDLRKKAVKATSDAGYALSNAALVFDMIQCGISTGSHNETHVQAVAELCGEALRRMAEDEGETLFSLSHVLEHNVTAITSDFGPEDPAIKQEQA